MFCAGLSGHRKSDGLFQSLPVRREGHSSLMGEAAGLSGPQTHVNDIQVFTVRFG